MQLGIPGAPPERERSERLKVGQPARLRLLPAHDEVRVLRLELLQGLPAVEKTGNKVAPRRQQRSTPRWSGAVPRHALAGRCPSAGGMQPHAGGGPAQPPPAPPMVVMGHHVHFCRGAPGSAAPRGACCCIGREPGRGRLPWATRIGPDRAKPCTFLQVAEGWGCRVGAGVSDNEGEHADEGPHPATQQP